MPLDLQKAYRRYNRKYWKDSLPDIPVSFGKLPKEIAGATRFHKYKPHHILIDRQFKALTAIALMTLLHEMCHVALPYRVDHGKPFQEEMLRLATAGAFEKLW